MSVPEFATFITVLVVLVAPIGVAIGWTLVGVYNRLQDWRANR